MPCRKRTPGIPGLPMGAAAMAYVLWTEYLKHNPKNPHWPDRDRFVLSAGHGSMLLYSLLYLTGYDLPLDELEELPPDRLDDPWPPGSAARPGRRSHHRPARRRVSPTASAWPSPRRSWPRATTGPATRSSTTTPTRIVSDGDIMEGVAMEAASLAGHLGLGKLIYLYDQNHITLAGSANVSLTEDVAARFEALGWHTVSIDGMDTDDVRGA